MEALPVFIILYAGMTHALETDHVLAVSTIVSRRRSVLPAMKDGMFWGLGHTSTILLTGILIILFRANIAAGIFSYFEAAVGLMLVLVAVYRLVKFFKQKEGAMHRHVHIHRGENVHTHVHVPVDAIEKNLHRTSYGIGLVHGLAGSGALVVVAMTQFKTAVSGVFYLLLFGLGSVMGMLLVAGFFSIPFSRKIINLPVLRAVLILVSSGLCLAYGLYVMYINLWRL